MNVRHDPAAWSTPERIVAVAAGARALVVRNRAQVDAALLDALPALHVVARAGTGLDNIDLDAADQRGVVVVAPLGANALSVAEHTLGLALAVARRIVKLDVECRAGGWNRTPGLELSGRTWGVLGAGATARAVARVAAALGMAVIAYDPYVDAGDPELAQLGVRLAPLSEVMATADVISSHLPATDATRHLVDASLLAHVKPQALFVSVGRGEVVDEEALADALESGRLAGAGLDVREQEPPVPGRLEKLDNVVLTPHVAGITAQSQERIVGILAADIEAVLSGAPARHAVGQSTRRRTA
nr:NAD(P)-dependent oxidoreductase [Phytoactinopolyspora mesophila]